MLKCETKTAIITNTNAPNPGRRDNAAKMQTTFKKSFAYKSNVIVVLIGQEKWLESDCLIIRISPPGKGLHASGNNPINHDSAA